MFGIYGCLVPLASCRSFTRSLRPARCQMFLQRSFKQNCSINSRTFTGTFEHFNKTSQLSKSRFRVTHQVSGTTRIKPLHTRREFHSTPRQQISPIVWLIVKPLAKLASMLSGRAFRQWWKTLSEDQKNHWLGRLFEHRGKIAVAGGLAVGAGIVHYVTHLQTTPITNRKRYVAFTPSQFLKIAQFEYEMQLQKVEKNVVAPTDPMYGRVVKTAQRIVNSNQDLAFMKEQTWTVLVVQSDEMNAFVLPTGHIFVFTGLLGMTENDTQLAVVLGHEMAHALLSHAAEQVSFAAIIDVMIIIVMAALWAFLPTDGIALVSQWFYNKVIEIMLNLPYSRKLEEEADEVGLHLIAKACYDVRESSNFWNTVDIRNRLLDSSDSALPQWLSTHPTNQNRADKLDTYIPKAIELRAACDCPKLPDKDPRSSLAYLRQLLEEKQRTKQEVNKTVTVSLPLRKGITISPPISG